MPQEKGRIEKNGNAGGYIMKYPEISVIIPVFNTGTILQDTIKSVLDQTFENFEIVIINDGSTDPETLKILSSLHDIRIRVIHQDNSGVAIARNRGIDESRGDYIAFLDHDDLFMPEKLVESVKIFEKYENTVTVYSDIIPIGNIQYCRFELNTTEGKIFDKLLAQNRVYSMSCAMVRKDIIEKFKIRFDELCEPCDDWDFHLRCALHGEFHYVELPLTKYRFYSGNQSRDQIKMRHAGIRTIHKYLRILSEISELSGFSKWKLFRSICFALSEHHYGIAFQYFGRRQFLPVFIHVAKAFFFQPLSTKVFGFVFRKLKIVKKAQ